MLKKIPVTELKLGMYIEKIIGSWLDSPFWQKHLLLERLEDLQRIQTSPIREVWVDVSKSRAVGAPVQGVVAGQHGDGDEDGAEEDAGRACQDATAAPAGAAVAPAPARPIARAPRAPLRSIKPTSMASELKHASALIKKSREAVCTMFTEARMGKAVTVEDAMPLVEEISESVMRNAGAMIGLARLKTADDYTYMHSVAVCALMIALGRQLELDDEQIRQGGLAGLLHDIGKMAVPLPILNKPGKLTDEEFNAVKQHPSKGHQMLLETPGMPDAALDVCLHHHEKIDGSGYPEGLKGDQISLFARMGAICDVYDAITSNRPYKQGWCPAESLRRMAEWSKGHFDERMFAAFIKCIGIYPVGTLVRLKSERLGVVVELPTGKSLIKPKVRIFYSAKAASYVRPELVDLASPAVTDSIVAREDAVTWGLKDVDRYWSGAIEFA